MCVSGVGDAQILVYARILDPRITQKRGTHNMKEITKANRLKKLLLVALIATAFALANFGAFGGAGLPVQKASAAEPGPGDYFALDSTPGVYYETLTEVLSEVGNGDTITLLQDYDGNALLSSFSLTTSPYDYTLDLGGHTIRDSSIGIQGGAVTLKNGAVINAKHTVAISAVGGDVTLDGLTVSATDSGADAVWVGGFDTLTVLSGDYYGSYRALGGTGSATVVSGHFACSATSISNCLVGSVTVHASSTAYPAAWSTAKEVWIVAPDQIYIPGAFTAPYSASGTGWNYIPATGTYDIYGDVTVVGAYSGATDGITFDFGTSNKTVTWKAELYGNTQDLVQLQGAGTFLVSGGVIENASDNSLACTVTEP